MAFKANTHTGKNKKEFENPRISEVELRVKYLNETLRFLNNLHITPHN